eukprot:COSAG05_NODE_2019_length_3686_cov_1.730694_4_plen_159_part_00
MIRAADTRLALSAHHKRSWARLADSRRRVLVSSTVFAIIPLCGWAAAGWARVALLSASRESACRARSAVDRGIEDGTAVATRTGLLDNRITVLCNRIGNHKPGGVRISKIDSVQGPVRDVLQVYGACLAVGRRENAAAPCGVQWFIAIRAQRSFIIVW